MYPRQNPLDFFADWAGVGIEVVIHETEQERFTAFSF